nr:hypothetical protein StreXyl84_15840 [Streptomyces sp. Xyl84]
MREWDGSDLHGRSVWPKGDENFDCFRDDGKGALEAIASGLSCPLCWDARGLCGAIWVLLGILLCRSRSASGGPP